MRPTPSSARSRGPFAPLLADAVGHATRLHADGFDAIRAWRAAADRVVLDLVARALAATDPALLGLAEDAHQQFLAIEPDTDPVTDGFSLRQAPRGARKSRGAFFTPPAIADAAAALLDEGTAPLADRVLDPACGSGRLLVALARRRLSGLTDPRDRRAAVVGRLHGQDTDVVALELARAALWLEIGDPSLPPAALAAQFRHADALAGVGGSFDAVLANPPWVSLGGRQKAAEGAPLLVRRHPALASWPALHSAFLLEALRDMIRPGGRVVMLLPSAVATHDRYAPVRDAVREIAAHAPVVVPLGEDAFEGVVQPSCLIAVDRRVPAAPCAPVAEWCGGAEGLGVPAALARFPVGTFCDVGVHTGNVSGKIIAPGARPASEDWVPCRQGRDIQAFHCGEPSLSLWTKPMLDAGEYCRIPAPARFARQRILLRQTAPAPIACRHAPTRHFRNSIIGCEGLDGVPDEVLVALLNSELVARWHRANSADARQRSFPQVKVRHLLMLPMPRGVNCAEARESWPAIIAMVRDVERDVARGRDAVGVRAKLDSLVALELGVPEPAGRGLLSA